MAGSSRAEDLRARVARLLGPDWPGPGVAAIERRGDRAEGDWIVEDLMFHMSDSEPVPAWFLRPPKDTAPVPAVLYAHAHGNRYPIGRDELLEGRPALQGPWVGDLHRLGYAALCLEMPCFGARSDPGEQARAKAALWQGRTLFGRMLAEQRAGLDFLSGHRAVRADRIGVMGFSMGGTLAWWLMALEPRLRAGAALGCLADLGTLVTRGDHDGHGLYMVIPGLLEVARSGQIAGLAAPRDLLVAVGLADWSTPPDAFAVARADLEAAYADAGAPERLQLLVEPAAGHEETPGMRAAVRGFLQRTLGA